LFGFLSAVILLRNLFNNISEHHKKISKDDHPLNKDVAEKVVLELVKLFSIVLVYKLK
jgi:hypothetical protein